MLPATSALVIGAALGMRHNVFILVPVSLVSAAAAVVLGMACDDSAWTIVLMSSLTVVALQIGYLLGDFASRSGAKQDLTHTPVAPIEGALEGAEVLYFGRYSLAKDQ